MAPSPWPTTATSSTPAPCARGSRRRTRYSSRAPTRRASCPRPRPPPAPGWGSPPGAPAPLRDAFVFASETCAFDLVEAEFIRELEPGEMVVVDDKGLRSYRPFGDARPRGAHFCVFEHVYFARPDSRVNGQSVYRVRERLRRQPAQEPPVDADVVIPVPDSGIAAAIGYARASGIPYDMGLIRSHYVGRTFIEPQQSIRHFGVKLKLHPLRKIIEGKRVIVIDDSIVRG